MKSSRTRIAHSYYLLSQENYWDSLKISYDVLVNELLKDKRNKISSNNDRWMFLMKNLYLLIEEKHIKNGYCLLKDFRFLSIFFNSFARKNNNSFETNYSLKICALNLLGLIEFLLLKNDSNETHYSYGFVNKTISDEIDDEDTKNIYDSTTIYFEIWYEIKTLFKQDFWEDISLDDKFSLFDSEECSLLIEYKEIIESNQLMLKKSHHDKITEIWCSSLDSEVISDKAKKKYYIKEMYGLLDNFRKNDNSSGKANVYSQEKEKAFHKNIYPYFANDGRFDLVLSELCVGNKRQDIVLYNKDNELSAIIELKVNELNKLDSNITQLEEYLEDSEEKNNIYMVKPQVGALVIYSIARKSISEMEELIESQLKHYSSYVKISNSFYLLVTDEAKNKPILVTLLEGK